MGVAPPHVLLQELLDVEAESIPAWLLRSEEAEAALLRALQARLESMQNSGADAFEDPFTCLAFCSDSNASRLRSWRHCAAGPNVHCGATVTRGTMVSICSPSISRSWMMCVRHGAFLGMLGPSSMRRSELSY